MNILRSSSNNYKNVRFWIVSFRNFHVSIQIGKVLKQRKLEDLYGSEVVFSVVTFAILVI